MRSFSSYVGSHVASHVGRLSRAAPSGGLAVACALAAAALGCSSQSSNDSGDAGMGTAPPDGQAGSVDLNPYGVPYPSNNIGTKQRGLGGPIAGDQIQDYKFLGYPGGDLSKPLQTISLADFYDPEGKLGYKLLDLGVAAGWCVPCNQETEAIVPLVPTLAKQGVVFAQALDEGTSEGTGADQADLVAWITEHKSNFDEMLDPENGNLGVFFDAAEVPWDAIIDTRTMEILQDGTGYSGNVQGDLSPWLTWVAQNPPSYPTP